MSSPPAPRGVVTAIGDLFSEGINFRDYGITFNHLVRVADFHDLDGTRNLEGDGVYRITQILDWVRLEDWPGFEGTCLWEVFIVRVSRQRTNGRDAHGLLAPIVTNRPKLCSDDTFFELGTCFDNTGRECFDWGICSCFPGPDPTPDGPDCPSPTGPTTGLQPECNLYTGSSYSPGITCRLKDDDLSRVFATKPIMQTANLMDNFLSIRSNQRCTNNWAVNNWGKIVSRCPDKDPPNLPDYYVGTHEDGGQTLWTYAQLRWNDDSPLGFEIGHLQLTPAREAEIKAKERVLQFVQTHQFPRTLFDRMDAIWLRLFSNSRLDTWSRTWLAGEPQTEESYGDFQNVPGERTDHMFEGTLLRTGCRVRVRLMVVAVYMRMSMILHRKISFNPSAEDGFDDNCFPAIRFAVTVTLRSRIELIDSCLDEKGKPLVTITYDRFGDPIIVGDTLKLDVDLPYEVQWHGGRGPGLLTEEWADVWFETGEGSRGYALSRKMLLGINQGSGYRIPGLYTEAIDHDTDEPKAAYRGSFNLKFCGREVNCDG